MAKYLTSWPQYHQRLKALRKLPDEVGAKDMGFHEGAKLGDIARFGARYRLAKSFVRVELDEYTDESVKAYSSLLRLMLTFSAFEQLLIISGCEKYPGAICWHTAGALLPHERVEVLCQEMKRYDSKDTFFTFIAGHRATAKDIRKDIEGFRNDEQFRAIRLFAAIRHCFAHGPLTAHVNDSTPRCVYKICDLVSSFLLAFMDEEFSRRLESAVNSVTSAPMLEVSAV